MKHPITFKQLPSLLLCLAAVVIIVVVAAKFGVLNQGTATFEPPPLPADLKSPPPMPADLKSPPPMPFYNPPQREGEPRP